MSVLDALDAAPLPTRRRFARWSTQEPALAGLRPDELRFVLLDDIGAVDYDRRDQLLAALVRLSRTDDQAHQLLVVCLLPGLRRLVTKHRQSLDRDDATAIVLAALCRRIASYRLLRRPRKIASNLLLDTLHDFVDARDKEQRWVANAYLSEHDPDGPPTDEPGESAEMVWAAARRAGVLSDREVALLRATRVLDIPVAQVAPLLGISVAAARKAIQRADHKLRAWWVHDDQVA